MINYPPVNIRHQVITFGSRYENIGHDDFPIIAEQPKQEFTANRSLMFVG